MAYVAHLARSQTPEGLEAIARKRVKAKRVAKDRPNSPELETLLALIEGPEAPECLGYLLDMHHDLYGRCGVTMEGYAPLTWEALLAYETKQGIVIPPHECTALMTLDAVRRHPPEEQAADG